jgi:hypothetical protein
LVIARTDEVILYQTAKNFNSTANPAGFAYHSFIYATHALDVRSAGRAGTLRRVWQFVQGVSS